MAGLGVASQGTSAASLGQACSFHRFLEVFASVYARARGEAGRSTKFIPTR
jgi:hypothetical protein